MPQIIADAKDLIKQYGDIDVKVYSGTIKPASYWVKLAEGTIRQYGCDCGPSGMRLGFVQSVVLEYQHRFSTN